MTNPADWIGKTRTLREHLGEGPVARLAATLDMERAPAPAGEVPNGWHWLYFLPHARRSELSADGHPARGGFMPPVDLPRRMFAGGEAKYGAPLALGREATLTERIAAVKDKTGRSGRLVFVEVERRLSQNGRDCVSERQTIVYREAARPGAAAPAPEPAPETADWRDEHQADPALLFRFSALTFNAHRIHYDRDYCRDEEGYPGLVVHGPLIALTMLEAARTRAGGRRPTSFSFRALSPLFDTAPSRVAGREDGEGAEVWAETAAGGLAMRGRAGFEGA